MDANIHTLAGARTRPDGSRVYFNAPSKSMPGPAHDNGREAWCNGYMVEGNRLFLLAEHASPAASDMMCNVSAAAVKATPCPKPLNPADFASSGVLDAEYLDKHDASEALMMKRLGKAAGKEAMPGARGGVRSEKAGEKAGEKADEKAEKITKGADALADEIAEGAAAVASEISSEVADEADEVAQRVTDAEAKADAKPKPKQSLRKTDDAKPKPKPTAEANAQNLKGEWPEGMPGLWTGRIIKSNRPLTPTEQLSGKGLTYKGPLYKP
jgi:hypothetical protein